MFGHGDKALFYGAPEVAAVLLVALLALACACLPFCCKDRKEHRRLKGRARAETVLLEHDTWSQDLGTIERDTQEALRVERYMTIDCWSLYTNRPWLLEPGPDVSVKELTPNLEWLDGQVFPNGESKQDSPARTIRGLWAFLWKKKTSSARISAFLQVIEGLCPAALARYTALIIHQIQSHSSDVHSSVHTLQLFAAVAGYCLVGLLKDRAHYYYEMEMPGASVRQELRQRLQRELLQMSGEEAKAWPSGRCLTLLNDQVHNMVAYAWLSLFDWIRHLTSLVALTAGMIFETWHSPEILLACLGVFAILCVGVYASVTVRRPNLIDLAKRKRDQKITWMVVADKQIHAGRAAQDATAEAPAEASTFLGNVTQVYRKRAFHFFFVKLLSGLASSELALISKSVVILILGREVMHHRMQISQMVGVMTLMASFRATLDDHVKVWLNMAEGYTSLLSIAQVFNNGLQTKHSDHSQDEDSMDTESEQTDNDRSYE